MTASVTVPRRWSAAMTTAIEQDLRKYLTRGDGQEDLTFLLYQTSTGATRTTALLTEIVPPQPGERLVHGNASFTAAYFLRAAQRAAEAGLGLGLAHAHPRGRGWQRLSNDDAAAERGHATQAQILTGHPLLGITHAGKDGAYSARFWPHATGEADPSWAESVRVTGARFHVSHNPDLRPPDTSDARLSRTVSAWGPSAHADLTRLRVGIIGAGSVGTIIGEALARTGFRDITIIDFDTVEPHNLDRLLNATIADIDRGKAELLAGAIRAHATAPDVTVRPVPLSVVEPDGWAEALDCDVLFSCVDRPWPRYALNVAAYAHLIPVIDGGIAVDVTDGQLHGAEWRAHVAAPGRRCLECLGQYDPGHIQTERDGLLDDPAYIAGLPADHALRRRENVFAFSLACASLEILELLRMSVAPSGIADTGTSIYHWTLGTQDHDHAGCNDSCPYSGTLLARGDNTGLTVTGHHHAAEAARTATGHPHRHRGSALRTGVNAGPAPSARPRSAHG
jgi:molybdopterin/thiamine biosynthesis adenylyltransferase